MNKRPTLLDLRKHELPIGSYGSIQCTNCTRGFSWHFNLEEALGEYQGLDTTVLQKKCQDIAEGYYWRLLHEIVQHFEAEHR